MKNDLFENWEKLPYHEKYINFEILLLLDKRLDLTGRNLVLEFKQI